MTRTCTRCGQPYETRGSAATSTLSYCQDPECRKEFHRTRQREFNAAHPGYYTPYSKKNEKKYQAERRAGTRPSKRKASPESYKAGDQLRRARKLGVDTEVFTTKEICERDGWVCGICEQVVEPNLRYPNPRSASLDHVVPLSLGGGHTRVNSRCSHLECNVQRGNRVE